MQTLDTQHRVCALQLFTEASPFPSGGGEEIEGHENVCRESIMRLWKTTRTFVQRYLGARNYGTWNHISFYMGVSGVGGSTEEMHAGCAQVIQWLLGSFSRLEWRLGGLFKSETGRKFPPPPTLTHPHHIPTPGLTYTLVEKTQMEIRILITH